MDFANPPALRVHEAAPRSERHPSKTTASRRSVGTLLTTALCAGLASPAQAFCEDPTTFVGGVCKTFSDTWRQGGSELLVPFHTHHLRYAYTREKIDSFVENTWGLGYGRTRFDERGNSDSLYAMGFRDSHGKFEPIVGYAHRWHWGDMQGANIGLGYTVFLTSREDIANYFPIPGILPVASFNYRRSGLSMSYLPGGAGNGNILFFWGNLAF